MKKLLIRNALLEPLDAIGNFGGLRLSSRILVVLIDRPDPGSESRHPRIGSGKADLEHSVFCLRLHVGITALPRVEASEGLGDVHVGDGELRLVDDIMAHLKHTCSHLLRNKAITQLVAIEDGGDVVLQGSHVIFVSGLRTGIRPTYVLDLVIGYNES